MDQRRSNIATVGRSQWCHPPLWQVSPPLKLCLSQSQQSRRCRRVDLRYQPATICRNSAVRWHSVELRRWIEHSCHPRWSAKYELEQWNLKTIKSGKLGWNALGGRHDTFNFDGWCSETREGGENGAWDAFRKQAMSRQRKHGWAAYSRHDRNLKRNYNLYRQINWNWTILAPSWLFRL